jgi:hypothetical protein
MNAIIELSPTTLRKAANIQEKIQSLQKQLAQLLGATAEPEPSQAPKKGKRKMSAAGRKAIAAAARARWAAIKAAKNEAKPIRKGKRKISAAGRAAISAASKARWAKVKALGKRKL